MAGRGQRGAGRDAEGRGLRQQEDRDAENETAGGGGGGERGGQTGPPAGEGQGVAAEGERHDGHQERGLAEQPGEADHP